MAGETQDPSIWPLPKFQFSVTMNGQTVSFQEVTGLDIEAQIIEYRAGDSKNWSTVKMPGIRKFGNVTLKKGIFVHDNRFWTWFSTIQMNTVARTPMTISLLDQTGKTTMVWTLANAWPTKITGTDLKADGNEVAVETIEVAHEGLTIANP
ncbi:MAG TPA: phage tail protein [Telluria sp.]|nr:phage tail protein [Telluria sp.]